MTRLFLGVGVMVLSFVLMAPMSFGMGKGPSGEKGNVPEHVTERAEEGRSYLDSMKKEAKEHGDQAKKEAHEDHGSHGSH